MKLHTHWTPYTEILKLILHRKAPILQSKMFAICQNIIPNFAIKDRTVFIKLLLLFSHYFFLQPENIRTNLHLMALAVVRNYKMLLNDVGKIVRNKRAQESKEKYKIGVSLHISFDAEIVLLVREIGSQQASLNLTKFMACLLERNEMNKWQQAYCLFAWYTDFEEKRFST